MNRRAATRTKHRRLTADVRRAIQNSNASVRSLSERYRVNPKTVRRWRGRHSIESRRPGPTPGKTLTLSPQQELLALAVRRLLRLPLDDCHYVLQGLLPTLSRPSLHRCFRRHGISRLPQAARDATQFGWFELHRFELGGVQPGPCLFIAIESASKFVIAQVQAAAAATAPQFLEHMVRCSPVRVQGVLLQRTRSPSRQDRELQLACVALGLRLRRTAPVWSDADRDFAAAHLAHVSLPCAESSLATFRRAVHEFASRLNDCCRLKVLSGLTPSGYLQRYARRFTRTHLESLPESSPSTHPQLPESQSDLLECRRSAILRCTRSLLASVGPEGLSLSKVARMAGVNRGTVYQHFKSREQLISAAADWGSEQLVASVFENLPVPSGKDGDDADVVHVMRRLASFAIRNPLIGQAWLLRVLSMPDPSKDQFWREYFSRSQLFHRTPLAAESIDAEVLSVVLLAGVFLWPRWARAKCHSEAELEQFVDRFVREVVRLALFGSLQAKHFPELVRKVLSTSPRQPAFALSTAAGSTNRPAIQDGPRQIHSKRSPSISPLARHSASKSSKA